MESIVAESVFYSYNKTTALSDISCNFFRGRIHALIGVNGAGKSTLMKLLSQLISPKSGRIYCRSGYERVDIAREKLAYASQEILLWDDLSVLEQLRFNGALYGMRGMELHRRVDYLLERLHLQSRRDSRASSLSGGMRRRLHLALSLLNYPIFLILDEPEAGIDVYEKGFLRTFLMEIVDREKVGVIYASHNLQEVEEIADDITILDRGKILYSGRLDHLRGNYGGEEILCQFDSPSSSAMAYQQMEDIFSMVGDGEVLKASVDDEGDIFDVLDRVRPFSKFIRELAFRRSTLSEIFFKLVDKGE